jgi:hypothetical protein
MCKISTLQILFNSDLVHFPLTINSHQSVCKKLSKMCYIIKALKDEVNPHILRNVYFAKFQPQTT